MNKKDGLTMETIEIEISSELYQRLRPYQKELAHILELGLGRLEETSPLVTATPSPASPEQVIAVLHQVGTVGADMTTIVANLNLPDNKSWRPLQTSGQSASEIIIQQRREMTGD
ncbi:MAG: hypothetical protein KDJ65_02620 [Anaerolineae bacterium]|nr:hypothetical protein [Anaerolineae bacterium]